MTDLTDFLLARYAEDEPSPDAGRCTDGREMLYITRQRRDLEAKRRIVERHQHDRTEYPPRFDEFDPHSIKVCRECGTHRDRWSKPCPTLRDLASVYADHPDYRQEWKPEL